MFSEKDLVYKREKMYFAFIFIISMLVYVALLFSIVGIIIAIVLLLTYWILHNVTMSNIRKNGARITKQQFPQFHEQAQQLAARMNINMPNIYVIQSGGVLNAFATKFGIKNMVVLYSDVFALIDEGGEDEVLYVLAHEFAHVKRQHVGYSWLLMPGLAMPFLGKAYSRACEFSVTAMPRIIAAHMSRQSVAY